MGELVRTAFTEEENTRRIELTVRKRFDFQVVFQYLENGLILATVLELPHLILIGDSLRTLERDLVVRLRQEVETSSAFAAWYRSLPLEWEIVDVDFEIAPPQRTQFWRDPITVRWPVLIQTAGSAELMHVSGLGLDAVIAAGRNRAAAVRTHARLHRHRVTRCERLRDVMLVIRCCRVERRLLRVEVEWETLPEKARRREEAESCSVLSTVATRMRPQEMATAYCLDDVVLAIATEWTSGAPRSVLLVGPAGVGKTAALHEVVRLSGELGLAHRPFWSTTGARLVAGMSGFGQWQERCLNLCAEAERTRAILHLGHLVDLATVGQHSQNEQSIADFLRPYVSRGQLTAVFECTPEQLSWLETHHGELLQVLHRVEISEPTSAVGKKILERVAGELSKKQGVKFEPAAVDTADRLHRRYAVYSSYPSRPIRFLSHLLAHRKDEAAVSSADVVAAFARETGLPRFLLDDTPLDLEQTRDRLARRVIGQPVAVDTVVELLASLKAGMTRPGRPIASLLLIGPTGVGKTEMAKALARLLYSSAERMVRIDMSEYSDALAVERLIGSERGREGILTSRVREQPFGVVLLDEFEKAHPRFHDLLLQVLGEGRLTDTAGRTADFCNSVIIMTSNLGAETFGRSLSGFAGQEAGSRRAEDHFLRAVQDQVRPEFLNRIDRVIPFLPLSREHLAAIARRELERVGHRDGFRDFEIGWRFSDAVVNRIVERGHAPQYGARALKRVIERDVLVPVADALTSTRTSRSKVACADVCNGRIVVRVSEASPHDQEDAQSTTTARESKSAVEQWMDLRRSVVALEESSALLAVRNEIEWMVRRRNRMVRRGNSQQMARRSAALETLRNLEQRVSSLLARVCHRENDLVADFGERRCIDAGRVNFECADLQRERNAIAELLYWREFERPHQAALVILGKHFAAMVELAKAYETVAQQCRWEATTYRIVRHQFAGEQGEPIRASARGISGDETGFRAVQMKSLPEQPEQELPQGLVGLAIVLHGKAAWPKLEPETGVHRFMTARRKHKGDESDCCVTVTPSLDEYVLSLNPLTGTDQTGEVVRTYVCSRRPRVGYRKIAYRAGGLGEALTNCINGSYWGRIESFIDG